MYMRMKDRLSGGFSDIVSQQKGQVFATDTHGRTQTEYFNKNQENRGSMHV
jgi:hypothetical protein